MSIVSTHPPKAPKVPKGFRLKKMGSIILWTFFFGLFAFSMSILLHERLQALRSHQPSNQHTDPLMSKLAEEVKALKEAQDKNYKWMNNIHESQRQILGQQAELNGFKRELLQEVKRVERMVMDTQNNLGYAQTKLRQHEVSLNNLAKDVQDKPNYNYNPHHTCNQNQRCQQCQQGRNVMMLNNAYNELANKLESFRNVLGGYDAKIRDNNRMIFQNIQELKNYVSKSKGEMEAQTHTYHNNQKDLITEVRNQKKLIEQASQNNIRQGSELREVSLSLNNLKQYTLESVQKLSNQKPNGAINGRNVPEYNGKVSNELPQLAADFKNFKEYTMETFKEIRGQQNRNTKRINHMESRESDREEAPISELVSQEVENVFNNFSEGKLLEKLLQQANLSQREIQVFVSIVKRLAEGDVNGVMNILNKVSGGDLLEKLMNSQDGLFNELKPLMELIKDVSEGNWSNLMKHISYFSS